MTGRIHCKGQNQRKKRKRKIERERQSSLKRWWLWLNEIFHLK